MKQSIQLRLGQHLTMTPQLQQAIRLLQLSSLELRTEVQEALESNMMLELAEDADGEESFSEQSNAATTETTEATETREGSRDDAEAAGTNSPEEIPEEMPVDTVWDEIYDSIVPSSGPGPDTASGEFEMQSSASEGLAEHLTWQLNLSPMSDRDRTIAMAVLDSVDNDGYLNSSVEELAETVNRGEMEDPVELDEVEAVLTRIQSFDPSGVAARGLGECLLLQLAQLPADTPNLANARLVVREHLEALGAHDYNQIMRRTKLSRESLRDAIELVQTLNPRPGSQFDSGETEYVVPDVFVRRKSGSWVVELNSDAVPALRVNQRYASMIRRADNSSDNTSLKSHLQEARWFIKSLQSRSETLLRVATAIVERQRGFLEHGEEAMKPLVLHDIAEVLEMHESTISRVTTRKYMHTPRGIFELKYFFSSHLSTSMGGEASSTAIRAVIKKLVAAENPQKPLSDSKIAGILQEQGIKVARRTIAKYREAMHIPPSNERKRLV